MIEFEVEEVWIWNLSMKLKSEDENSPVERNLKLKTLEVNEFWEWRKLRATKLERGFEIRYL